jgi:hypothetical protein
MNAHVTMMPMSGRKNEIKTFLGRGAGRITTRVRLVSKLMVGFSDVDSMTLLKFLIGWLGHQDNLGDHLVRSVR